MDRNHQGLDTVFGDHPYSWKPISNRVGVLLSLNRKRHLHNARRHFSMCVYPKVKRELLSCCLVRKLGGREWALDVATLWGSTKPYESALRSLHTRGVIGVTFLPMSIQRKRELGASSRAFK